MPEDTRLAISSVDLPSNTPPSPTIEETKPEISSVEFLGIIPPAALAVDIRMSISSDDFPSRTPPKVSVRAPESSAKRPDTASKPKTGYVAGGTAVERGLDNLGKGADIFANEIW